MEFESDDELSFSFEQEKRKCNRFNQKEYETFAELEREATKKPSLQVQIQEFERELIRFQELNRKLNLEKQELNDQKTQFYKEQVNVFNSK